MRVEDARTVSILRKAYFLRRKVYLIRPRPLYSLFRTPSGPPRAEVAELADALASGASGRKGLGGRVPASAPVIENPPGRHLYTHNVDGLSATLKRTTNVSYQRHHQAHHRQRFRLHRDGRWHRILLSQLRVHEHSLRLHARRRERDIHGRPGPQGSARREREARVKLNTSPDVRKAIGVRVHPRFIAARPPGTRCP